MLLTSTVLKVRPHRESDRLYTVYTRERGKLTVLGVGTGKITSKLAGHLGQFTISELSIVPARTWEKLIGADIVETFPRILLSLDRIATAFFILELVDALTKENHPDPALWQLLTDSLRELSIGQAPSRVRQSFETQCLTTLGERPPLVQHLSVELKSSLWPRQTLV